MPPPYQDSKVHPCEGGGVSTFELRSEVGQPNPKGILTLLRKRVLLTMLRITTSDFFFELHTRKHFKKRVFCEVHVNVKKDFFCRR